MATFPDWAQELFKSSGGKQVSHGLNLALPLEHPSMLPLLLWDILAAQPKIDRALEELSFIHYARFVPSWDGTALMVTTEFDGPLEPYVMDFVIAIGDVFDTLLSYVRKDARPALPTREHPEAFWNFVKKWNRVPFARRFGNDESVLFPEVFDYPLYSSYPLKTVTDIAGKRIRLPSPAIDHPASAVDLDDVQGNILRGYKAKSAVHLFLSIEDAKAARLWLSTVLTSKQRGKGMEWGGVTSAATWKPGPGGPVKPKVMTNVAFTYAGMKVLLPRRTDLEAFPIAFREGSEQRSEANGDKGDSAPGRWLFGRSAQNIHVVLSLYASYEEVPLPPGGAVTNESGEAVDALLKGASSSGMKLVHAQATQALAEGRVYFGYRDGIAQPRISGQCEPNTPDHQPAASPGEFLLGETYKSIFGGSSLGSMPTDLATNGAFGAMRLLEQDVDLFEQTIRDEAKRLAMTEKLLKAKLVGRWLDGEPLALDDTAPSGNPSNDFDYSPSWEYPKVHNDHNGARCPVGAHIRRVNPRTARVAGHRHARRVIRRGMPSKWTENGSSKVGLLGLFIGASIERQFEFIQAQWIQGDLAASGIRGTQDPIAGLRSKPTELDVGASKPMNVPPLVTTRGSLYLFFPGISMLRGLHHATAPSALLTLDRKAARYDHEVGMSNGPEDPQFEASVNLRRLEPSVVEFLNDLRSPTPDSLAVKTFVAELAPRERAGFAPAAPGRVADFDPLDPEFIADPFPTYARLRRDGVRMVWVPEHAAYWVLQHADAVGVLNDHAGFLQQPSGTTLRGIITLDGVRHTVVRRAVAGAFTAATQKLGVYIDTAIDAAFLSLKGLKQFDFVTAYGAAVPRSIFWRFFGLRDKEDIEACNALAQTMMRHYSQPEGRDTLDQVAFTDASIRLTARLGWQLGEAWLHQLNPFSPFKDTVIGEIAKVTSLKLQPPNPNSLPLSFIEALMTLVQVVLASTSTQFLMGTAMRNFLRPDPRVARAGQTPWGELGKIAQTKPGDLAGKLQQALDEARRIDPPVTIIQRYAADTQTVCGITVSKDCPVFALVGSSNRDAVVGASPEEFHWDRTPGTAHLSLGDGIHECVGTALQATMIPAALTRLLAEMPDLRLCNHQAVPAWIDNVYFRTLLSLPVTRCPPLDGRPDEAWTS